MTKPDYGPTGCCGPAAAVMLLAATGVLGVMVWLVGTVVS